MATTRRPPELQRRNAWVPRFKIVVLGDSHTGKTSIVHRVVSNTFSEYYEPTIGIEFHHKKVRYGRHDIFLQFWDTSGHDRFHTLMPTYLRNSAAVIVVYDVTHWPSFLSVPLWVALAREHCGNDLPVFVLGAKAEDDLHREVSTKQGCLMSLALGVRFSETSALSGHNITAADLFEEEQAAAKEGPSVKRAMKGLARSFGLKKK